MHRTSGSGQFAEHTLLHGRHLSLRTNSRLRSRWIRVPISSHQQCGDSHSHCKSWSCYYRKDLYRPQGGSTRKHKTTVVLVEQPEKLAMSKQQWHLPLIPIRVTAPQQSKLSGHHRTSLLRSYTRNFTMTSVSRPVYSLWCSRIHGIMEVAIIFRPYKAYCISWVGDTKAEANTTYGWTDGLEGEASKPL